MTDAQVWHFYHIARKKKYGPFSALQLCTIFTKNNIQSEHILIFKKGWEKWQTPLKEPYFEKYFNSINHPNSNKIEETVIASNVVELKKASDERSITQPDIKANLTAIIICDKKSFKTNTELLGKETIILQHNLPEDFNGKHLSVYIRSPDNKTSIKLEAKIIKNTNESLSINTQNEFSSNTYSKWLNHFYEKNSKQGEIKKSA